jgi:hypothetical protein
MDSKAGQMKKISKGLIFEKDEEKFQQLAEYLVSPIYP